MTSRRTATTPTVERTIELDADVETVWETMTDPDGLDGWLGDHVELDLQPGGCGRVVDDEGAGREVLVTAVEPARRLAWHWWSDGGELSTVDITLAPLPGGRSRVAVVETLTEGDLLGGTGLRAEASAAVGRLAAIGGRSGLRVTATATAGAVR